MVLLHKRDSNNVRSHSILSRCRQMRASEKVLFHVKHTKQQLEMWLKYVHFAMNRKLGEFI